MWNSTRLNPLNQGFVMFFFLSLDPANCHRSIETKSLCLIYYLHFRKSHVHWSRSDARNLEAIRVNKKKTSDKSDESQVVSCRTARWTRTADSRSLSRHQFSPSVQHDASATVRIINKLLSFLFLASAVLLCYPSRSHDHFMDRTARTAVFRVGKNAEKRRQFIHGGLHIFLSIWNQV